MTLNGQARRKRGQRGHLQLELAAVALLVIMVKASGFRPKHLQSAGFPKRRVMRVLRRLADAGIITKTAQGYSISPRIIAKTKSVCFGLDELDGFAEFLFGICYGDRYTPEQVDECLTRLGERGKRLAAVGACG